MEYNSCSLRFPKIIRPQDKVASLKISDKYNTSLLGNECPLFGELRQLSNDMENENKIKF